MEPLPIEPQQPPQDTRTDEQLLQVMRTSYKLAAVSHFVGLYSHHLDFKHQVHELEQDLLPSRIGQEVYLPYMLGKLLNTLANDRNTNHTNWLNALRRSYNRRVTLRQDNPFYQWIRVPSHIVEQEIESERLAKLKEAGSSDDEIDEERKKGIFVEEEERLRLAEGKKYRRKLLVKEENSTEAAPQPPLTREGEDDAFNGELADVIAGDKEEEKETVKLENELEEVKKEENGNGVKAEEGEEEWWEEQRAVEWKDLSLETKIDAIYNVCEWHMVDPDRQFRKYLQFDGESAWRLDPTGLDSSQNYYYHLSDDRLWIQRPIPTLVEARSLGCPEAPNPITKPKSLLGLRAGPRDKSKKGTITGTVRFKLKRDPKSGEFRQVREDEEEGAGFKKKKNNKNGDGEYGDGERMQEEDEEDLDAELEDTERQKAEQGREEQERLKAGEEKDRKEESLREMPSWEKEFWEERWRAENTPGFKEWEAVCITLEDWQQFADRYEHSQDQDELDLRQYALDWIPEYQKILQERAKSRDEEIASLQRRGTTRGGGRDSTMDTVARLAAEEAALAERFTRVTRGQMASLDDSTGSSSPFAGSSKQVTGESREERLKKREDEKRAREEAEENKMLEEVRERERQEAREQNGGVLPFELMNEEEKEEYNRAIEAEKKRVQKENEKKKREDVKRQRAKERRAELKAEKEAAEAELAEFEAEINPHDDGMMHAQDQLPVAPAQYYQQQPAAPLAQPLNEEPPWYTDCEVCGRQGWNIDDGVETICCEQCEEWQHLPCHIQRDALEGRHPVNYSDDAYQFYCVRCQAQPGRRPRPVPPAHELPPPPPPILVPPPAPVAPPPQAIGGKRKAQSGKAQPAPKKAKAQKQQPMPANGVPYGHGHHPLYHPSAYSHVQHSVSPTMSQPSPPPPPQPVAPQPAPAAPAAQPQMTYEELSARVQQDPRLLGQLPPAYQQHFSEKFGIPMP